MPTSSFVFNKLIWYTYLKRICEETYPRVQPRDVTIIIFTATHSECCAPYNCIFYIFYYVEDHRTSSGLEKWQRYPCFYSTQLLWVKAFQIFVKTQITAHVMPWNSISVSAKFHQTKCSERQSTMKMEPWGVSGDEAKRLRKDVAWPAQGNAEVSEEWWDLRKFFFLRYIALFTKFSKLLGE